MIAHLVGNGPTKQFFKNEPAGNVFCCNFGSPNIDCLATFIHDKKPLMHILNTNTAFHLPIIYRSRYKSLIDQLISKNLIMREKVSPLCDTIREKSSGHDGLLFLLRQSNNKYNEIHMWGFDSLVTGKVTSDSKEKIRGSCPNQSRVPIWQKRFREIFKWATKRGQAIYLHHNAEKVEKVA